MSMHDPVTELDERLASRLVHTPDLTVSTDFGEPARFASAYAWCRSEVGDAKDRV
jgi:hypothetical protein